MNSNISKMLNMEFCVIAGIPRNDFEVAVAMADAGADLMKVHLNLDFPARKISYGSFEEEKASMIKIREAFPDMPLGVVPGWQGMISFEDMKEIEKIGYDFIDLYAHDFPCWLWNETSMEKMLAIDHSYTESQIKYFDEAGMFAIEACTVPLEDTVDKRLTLEDCRKYKHISSCTKVPVYVACQRIVLKDDLRSLKNAGVKGVALGARSLDFSISPAEAARIVAAYK